MMTTYNKHTVSHIEQLLKWSDIITNHFPANIAKKLIIFFLTESTNLKQK